jgi:hypothetical protein
MSDRCNETFMDGYYTARCARKAKKDGKCGQHHPDAVKARREKASKNFRDRQARERSMWITSATDDELLAEVRRRGLAP